MQNIMDEMELTPNQEEQWLTPNQIAERLQVDLRTVRRRLRSRELKGYKFGERGDWRVRPSDLMAFLEASTTKCLSDEEK